MKKTALVLGILLGILTTKSYGLSENEKFPYKITQHDCISELIVNEDLKKNSIYVSVGNTGDASKIILPGSLKDGIISYFKEEGYKVVSKPDKSSVNVEVSLFNISVTENRDAEKHISRAGRVFRSIGTYVGSKITNHSSVGYWVGGDVGEALGEETAKNFVKGRYKFLLEYAIELTDSKKRTIANTTCRVSALGDEIDAKSFTDLMTFLIKEKLSKDLKKE